MFCTECGQTMADGAKFCAYCGTRRAVPTAGVDAPPTPAPPVPETPPPAAPQTIRTIRSTAEIMPIRLQRPLPPTPPPMTEAGPVETDEPELSESVVPWPTEESAPPLFTPPEPPVVSRSEKTRSTAPPEGAAVPPPERYTSVPFAAPPGSHDSAGERRRISPVLIGAVIVALIALAGIIWMVRSSMSPSAAAAKVEISIFPTTAKMAAGKSADFKANLTGPPTDQVIWKVDEGDSGGQVQVQRASEGANSMYSTYTAPKTPGTYHLVASSTADPTKSATAEITVTAK